MISFISILFHIYFCYTSGNKFRTSSLLIFKPKSEFTIKVDQESSIATSLTFEYVKWLKLDFGVGSKTEIVYKENEGVSSIYIKCFKEFCMVSSEKPFKPIKSMKFNKYNGLSIEFIGDSKTKILCRDSPKEKPICIKNYKKKCIISSDMFNEKRSLIFDDTEEIFMYFVKNLNTRYVIKRKSGYNVINKDKLHIENTL